MRSLEDIPKKRDHGWLFWFLDNAFALTVFAGLAIYFNTWWIVLFAVLFVSSYKSRSPEKRICDGCGNTIQSYDDINKEAEMRGWIRKNEDGVWKDYCPKCKGEHIK